ncbi:hypothetical protein [Amycolatopsis magusensis]|uniref:hypothetical protein n=1 Tax=Amycolatopsis magusensis TaxID=882444 RepID=UPI003C2BE41C
MKTYHAEASRDGQYWQIQVRELDRHTQALSCQDIPMVAGGPPRAADPGVQSATVVRQWWAPR